MAPAHPVFFFPFLTISSSGASGSLQDCGTLWCNIACLAAELIVVIPLWIFHDSFKLGDFLVSATLYLLVI